MLLPRLACRAPLRPAHCRALVTAHAVVYEKHGDPLDVLRTHEFAIDESSLDPFGVVVKTIACPINPSDINQIQGVYPSKPGFNTALKSLVPVLLCGNEGLFQVTHVGSDVKRFAVGDWCVPAHVNFGTWRTHAVGTESSFIQLPNPSQLKEKGKPCQLTVNQAATISVNPPTALLMLTRFSDMRPGRDWFIQNGGNSAVGQYASQIGRLLGINSISVVRDRDDFDALLRHLADNAGATRVISALQNELRDFSATIKEWVHELGGEIRLALNCVGGKSSTAIARKLLPNGQMLTYGGMSMQPVSLPTSLHIFKNITSRGFWVTDLLKKDMALKTKTLRQIVEWYEQGKLRDAPSRETPVPDPQDLASVFQAQIREANAGKQLIVF